MAQSIEDRLKAFDPATAGAYDPGHVVVLFDHRGFKTPKDQMGYLQNYWLATKYRLGWPSIWWTTDLEPGLLRLVWYTHAGTEGSREYPLHMAYAVKDMFDDLAEEGFRPLIIGWTLENPYPMIGGSEPPAPPVKKEPKRATTWSHAVSGHAAGTPHERVMAIIQNEEEREREERAKEVGEVKGGDEV